MAAAVFDFLSCHINILRRSTNGWKGHRHPRSADSSVGLILSAALEFDENRHVQTVLSLAQIGEPRICRRTVAGRESAETHERTRGVIVAARRRHAPGARKIWHVRG